MKREIPLEQLVKEKKISQLTCDKVKIAKEYIEHKYNLKVIKNNEWSNIIEKINNLNLSENNKNEIYQNIIEQESAKIRSARKKNSIFDYESLGIIGKGAFGEVHVCREKSTGNIYAIKKIKKGNNENVSNIINEINILKIMKCKHSVEFIEYIEKDDYIYIVMELCDGDLNYLLKKMNKKIDIITIVKIIIQLNEVIKLMHEKKIEHRDLKPENILIKFKDEEDFDIKLTDYGFSKSYQSNSKYSKIVGTMYYSPPEVYMNEGNSKSDLWSIGLILYYLYFNNIPFNYIIDFSDLNKNANLNKTNFDLLDDLLSKLLIENPNERINWDNYFIHPFVNLQIIEIYIYLEKDNKNIKILDNKYFKYEQLKDSKIFIDENEKDFNTNFILNIGYHIIIILFNNELTNCYTMFENCNDIKEIKFINFKTNKVTDMSFMFNKCSNLINLDVRNFNTENVKFNKNMLPYNSNNFINDCIIF